MIHFFHRSHAKKPESGLFSDWIGNNMDDLRCSDWQKRCHPLCEQGPNLIQNSQVITRSIGNLLAGKSLAGKLLAGLLFAVKLLVTSSPVRNKIRSIRIHHL